MALRWDDAARTLDLGVHDLIDAGPARGDLRLDLAWSQRVRLRAGQDAHTAWQSARAAEDAGFRREVVIRHRVERRGWLCTISGRVDGLSAAGDRLRVEELKSTTLPAERLDGVEAADFPAWARQVQIYLHALAAARTPADGELVLVSLADGARVRLPVAADPALGDWIDAQLDHLVWSHEDALAWAARRALAPVPFPHDTPRPGQDTLTDWCTARLTEGMPTFLAAPTGTGKTAVALTAALRAARETGRRVLFVTARNTQQRLAEETVARLADRGLPLRTVTLRAREKLCLNEQVVCRADTCRFAAGHHDKLREGDARGRAWGPAGGAASAEVLREIGTALTACPAALGAELAADADLVIGDYNYAFDPGARLGALAEAPERWVLVVDEAHNLAERAMGYGSPGLRVDMAEAAAESVAGMPGLGEAHETARTLVALLRRGVGRVPVDAPDGAAAEALSEAVPAAEWGGLAARFEAAAMEVALARLRRPVGAPGAPDPWLEAARAVQRVRAAVERAGPETVALWRRGTGPVRRRPAVAAAAPSLFGTATAEGPLPADAGLQLVCRDPARVLGPLLRSVGGVLFLSATLAPVAHHQRAFGLADRPVAVRTEPSPFPPEHRRVLVVGEVSTEYRHRARDAAATASAIAASLRGIAGNAAVFFSSWAMLEALVPTVDVGGRPVLVQSRTATEAERAALLDTMLRAEGHVLFAVLGGVFAEGVDLPGAALRGAVIVGPALPAVGPERRLIEDWAEAQGHGGFQTAYLVPGMTRVVQAAGRVWRSAADRGAIVLICRRFLRDEYRALLPPEWVPERTRDPAAALAGWWDLGAV